MSVQVANELRKILFELESTRLQEGTVSARRRLLALAERLEDAGFPTTDTQPAGTPDRCGARYDDAGEPVVCDLPPGHRGFHVETATGFDWGPPHPDTPGGPGVLGRALLDADGAVWPEPVDRATVERNAGPVREVLLVVPAAGRVLDAARELRAAELAVDLGSVPGHWGRFHDATVALAAAVDAYDRPTTGASTERDQALHEALREDAEMDALRAEEDAEPAPEPAPIVNPAWAGSCLCEDREAHELDCRQGHRADCPADCWGAFGCPRRRRHDPAPALEAAGDGPGWCRCTVKEAIAMMRIASRDRDDGRFTVNMVEAVRALLADRDRWQGQARSNAEATFEAVDKLNTARAELEHVRELATARRDAAADALQREAAQLARGETWADTFGRWNADQAEAAGVQKQLMVDRLLNAAAALRRPVPGSPQPAPAGGEEEA